MSVKNLFGECIYDGNFAIETCRKIADSFGEMHMIVGERLFFAIFFLTLGFVLAKLWVVFNE